MGTNYYAGPSTSPCEKCGHVVEAGSFPANLHIGKSSAGWRFLFRIQRPHPDLVLDTAKKWWAFLADRRIEDEYGHEVNLDDFKTKVKEKQQSPRRYVHDDYVYDDEGHEFVYGEFS